MPVNDLVAHDSSDDCVCHPRLEAVLEAGGPDGWVWVHHSLDGREAREDRREWMPARVNWPWIKARLGAWRCRHVWMIGSRVDGKKACRKCGVWHWFPVIKGMWL